ncbi:MAG: bacteriohopanetetrol glucosamine biosynthesis glycosyltransferase HpnI [Acidithiobacillus sp.]
MSLLNGWDWLKGIVALLVLATMAYQLLGFWALHRWRPVLTGADQIGVTEDASADPSVSVLKPLHGDDGSLYDSLRSFCRQNYPQYEIICGVQHPADPAMAVIQRLQAEFPALALRVVVTEGTIGNNPKVNNLMGILAACRYDLLVISDADIVVGPHYLRHLVPSLQDPQVGVLTCLYRALPLKTFWSRVLASQVNTLFLPSVLVAAKLGPNIFCGGASMALRRETLAAMGGLPRLANQLADDYWLGAYVRQCGKPTVLADYVVDTLVLEPDFKRFYQHALRWSLTTRSVQPVGHRFSFLSYPLPLVCILAPCLGGWGWIPLGVVLVLRLVYHRQIMHKLGAKDTLGTALLADFLGLLIWFHALFARRIAWRGSQYAVAADGQIGGQDGATQ